MTRRNPSRCDGVSLPARPGLRTVAHAEGWSWKPRTAARQKHRQPMHRAEAKRSARGEEGASTFPVATTRSHLRATTPALCSEQGIPVSRGWETTALLPGGQEESRCKPTNDPACRLFPPLSQVRPVFIPSSSATLFLCRRPGIEGMFLHT